MIKCTNCGKELDDAIKFCDQCGTATEQPEEVQQVNEVEDVEKTVDPTTEMNSETEQPVAEPVEEAPVDSFVEEALEKAESVKGAPEVAAEEPVAPVLDDEKKKKVIKWSAIVAAVLVVVMLVSSLFSGGNKQDYVLYIKDNQLNYSGLSKIKPFEVTEELVSSDALENGEDYYFSSEEWMAYSAGWKAYITEDGKTIFYAEEMDENNQFDLYYRKLNRPKKEGEKIASSISNYVISKSGKVVTYKKDGKLYQGNLKDSEKIANNVTEYRVSEDGKKIYFVSNGKLYLKQKGKDKVKLDKDASIEYVSEDFKTVYYTKGENLYKKVGNKDKVKIASDVSWIVKVYESGEVYYCKSDTETVTLMDYVNDDMVASDKKIKEPEEPEYPDLDDYDEYDDYRAAYEKYRDEWEEYSDAYDVYEEKEERDELREELKETEIEKTTYTLYYTKGKKSVKLAENVTQDSIDYLYENPIAAFQVQEEEKTGKIVDLSDIDYAFEVEEMVSYGEAEEGGTYKVAVKGKVCDFKQKQVEELIITEDGKNIYFLDNVSKKSEEGTLYQIKVSNNKIGKPKKYDTDVCDFSVQEGVVICYKDADEDGATLYVNKKKVASDVDLYSAEYNKETKDVLFMADYKSEKQEGTLMVYNGKKAKEVSDDVHEFTVIPNGKVLYLADYNSEKSEGELFIWNGNKAKLVDDDVSYIVPIYNWEE